MLSVYRPARSPSAVPFCGLPMPPIGVIATVHNNLSPHLLHNHLHYRNGSSSVHTHRRDGGWVGGGQARQTRDRGRKRGMMVSDGVGENEEERKKGERLWGEVGV